MKCLFKYLFAVRIPCGVATSAAEFPPQPPLPAPVGFGGNGANVGFCDGVAAANGEGQEKNLLLHVRRKEREVHDLLQARLAHAARARHRRAASFPSLSTPGELDMSRAGAGRDHFVLDIGNTSGFNTHTSPKAFDVRCYSYSQGFPSLPSTVGRRRIPDEKCQVSTDTCPTFPRSCRTCVNAPKSITQVSLQRSE